MRNQGVMNECQDKREQRLERVIGRCTKMVGWKVGEGGGQCLLVKDSYRSFVIGVGLIFSFFTFVPDHSCIYSAWSYRFNILFKEFL